MEKQQCKLLYCFTLLRNAVKFSALLLLVSYSPAMMLEMLSINCDEHDTGAIITVSIIKTTNMRTFAGDTVTSCRNYSFFVQVCQMSN